MSIEPTQLTLKVVTKAVPAITEEAKGFIKKLLGPAADELGLALQDHVRGFRLKQQLKILEQSMRHLKEKGIEPIAVPLKILVPLLEGASLEDERDTVITEKWANLLANAANPVAEIEIHPSFPMILSQITAKEARLLDTIFLLVQGDSTDLRMMHPRVFSQGAAIEESDVSDSEYDLFTDNLIRLGLLAVMPPNESSNSRTPAMLLRGVNVTKTDRPMFPFRDSGKYRKERIAITKLGIDFVAICKGLILN